MKRNKIKLLIVCLFVILTCTYTYAARKEQIQDISKISWIGKTWYEGTKFYFSGISEPTYSLKKAKELAYNDAALNAAKYLGIKISNQTTSSVNNNIVKVNEATQSSFEDTLISAAIIKEFFFTEKKDKYTAYVLLEIDREILKKEQNRKEEVEQIKKEKNKKKAEQIEENKKAGPYNIIVSDDLQPILPDIKNLFKKQGYSIENTNDYYCTPIYVNIVHENLQPAIDNLVSYELRVELIFNDETFVMESKKLNVNANRTRILVLKDILKQMELKLNSISNF